MHAIKRRLTIGLVAVVLGSAVPLAAAAPLTVPGLQVQPSPAVPVDGLLCGRGWHWSYVYLKCERNRHRCPAGKHWISLLRTCVGL